MQDRFFQLLFVALLNLVMVLMCLKYCQENVLLNGVLLVISMCTYVMIASAIYRDASVCGAVSSYIFKWYWCSGSWL